MSGKVAIRRALVSVSDKAGVVEFVRGLIRHGAVIISTGGTERLLAEAGIDVMPVESVTGFPEMMGGRIKTLHPGIHGGILARRDDPSHIDAMRSHGIDSIDLVCVNLYPFEATVAREETSRKEAVEMIDIGGPAMVRAAAKNHEFVTVVTDPSQYGRVLSDLDEHGGCTSRELRQALSGAAFARTASYDTAIASYLSGAVGDLAPRWEHAESLRYGENPHQSAVVYRDTSGPGGLVDAGQLHGKPMSYNNLNDAAGAWRLVHDLLRQRPDFPGAVVIKHTNPCGAAIGAECRQAVRAAIAGDPLAAYGGVLAVNAPIDGRAAEAITEPDRFFEVILAPGYDDDALERIRQRWKNVRVLRLHADAIGLPWSVKTIPGGALYQSVDDVIAETGSWVHAAGPKPDAAEVRAAAIVWLCAKHLTSNAIAIGGRDPEREGVVRLFGAGAGQMDRVSSCEIAVRKAGELARGAIAASDAFFPFADGPERLIDAGVTMLVHPGGSKRDEETFDLCNDRGVTCMTTGVRHFRH